jgi:hypothetical protein
VKDFFLKIGAICLIAVLMLSTSSFSVFKHFCGDNLVNVSFEKVESCCEKEIESNTFISDELNFSEKDCCKNETTIKELSFVDYTKSLKISKSKVVFITAFYYSFIENSTEFSAKQFFKDFSPPDIVFNKQIQFQSFLI